MHETLSISLPYFITKVKDHNLLKEEVLRLIDEEPSSHIRNKPPYERVKTDYGRENNKEDRKYWLRIRHAVKEAISPALKKCGFVNLNLGLYWFQQYTKGGFHYPHIHSGVDWTSIYYVELPNRYSVTHLGSYTSSAVIVPGLEEGCILTFPGVVPHYSPEITDINERKTIIVFNLRSEYEPYLRD